jgi:hypothetical protein
MKNQITINPNHPAYLHCEMVLTTFQERVSAIQTENQVREIARQSFAEDTSFFWGCGSNHLWVHHCQQPTERVFIAYF